MRSNGNQLKAEKLLLVALKPVGNSSRSASRMAIPKRQTGLYSTVFRSPKRSSAFPATVQVQLFQLPIRILHGIQQMGSLNTPSCAPTRLLTGVTGSLSDGIVSVQSPHAPDGLVAARPRPVFGTLAHPRLREMGRRRGCLVSRHGDSQSSLAARSLVTRVGYLSTYRHAKNFLQAQGAGSSDGLTITNSFAMTCRPRTCSNVHTLSFTSCLGNGCETGASRCSVH